MNSNFPYLFSPIQVGTHTYKNRIEVAPIGGMEFLPDGQLDQARMYPDIDARAKGGAAAFLMGETAVSVTGGRGPHTYYNFRDLSAEHLAPYKEVAAHIHQFGCEVLLELCHVGAAKADNLSPACGPDECVNEAGIHIHRMTEEDIEQCCQDFADAAYFLKVAGFDGVLIHAGHGWLFTQFLSPLTNHRTDRFGGSLENRSRFTVEVLKAIRMKCGPDFIIECRISGDQHIKGGYSLNEICQYCAYISPYCDLIHVSAGMYRDPMRSMQISTLLHPHFCNAEVAAAIKRSVSIPVSVVGGINSPEEAERRIAAGELDMVALGRQLKADALWPEKAACGDSAEIRRCLRCMRCFPGPFEEAVAELKGNFPEGCSINPAAKHPDCFPTPKAEASKKILVAGGGPAGLQSAITAAERGHQVMILEKEDRLGGILNYAEESAEKQDLYHFAQTLEVSAKNRGVQIMAGTPFSEELLKQFAPDAVIIAVGSSPATPPIPGFLTSGVLSAMDAYRKDAAFGARVLILGGGQVGCETAIHLAKQGNRVTLVEMGSELAPDAYRLYKHQLRDLMGQYVDYRLNTTCIAIEPGKVVVRMQDGTEETLMADTILSALGMKANPTEEIITACTRNGIPYEQVGDCVRPRKLYDAIEEGFLAGLRV